METQKRSRLREHAAGDLRAELAREQMSALELARRLGWKQAYVYRRVDGSVALDLDDLEAISAVLPALVARIAERLTRSSTDSEPMVGYAALYQRMMPATRRPPNNRPNGRAPADPGPGLRRTVKLPRVATA